MEIPKAIDAIPNRVEPFDVIKVYIMHHHTQGVVTLIEPVEPFATGIKMKSRDKHVILY